MDLKINLLQLREYGTVAEMKQDIVHVSGLANCMNGQLVQIGVERGRNTRPTLKVGICGEHGGDPASVEFFHRAGLNYVSCSPYRVPIARLAAAQAALGDTKRDK